jgi:hypothetical protein
VPFCFQDASASLSFDGGQLEYIWFVNGVPLLAVRSASSSPPNYDDGNLGTFLASDQRLLQLHYQELVHLNVTTASTSSIQVGLIVKRRFNQTVSQNSLSSLMFTQTILVSQSNIPSLSVIPPVTLSRSRTTTVPAFISPSACSLDSAVVGYSFVWSVSPALPGSNIVFTRKELEIPANTLTCGVSYVFSVQVSVFNRQSGASSPLFVLQASSAPTLVEYAPLVVSVRGGDRALTINSPLVLDGSSSYDPDSTLLLASVWTCQNFTGFVPDSDIAMAPYCRLPVSLHLADLWLNVPAWTFGPNEHFCFQLRYGVGTARESFSSCVHIYTLAAPEYPNPVIVIDSASDLFVNPSALLRIAASASSPMLSSSLVYEWSEVTTSTPNALLDMRSEKVRASAMGGSNLVIRGSALVAGAFYRLQLTVTDSSKPAQLSGGSAFAVVNVYVNDLPHGGSCRVTAMFDASLVSSLLRNGFVISCRDWSDNHGSLFYQFGWYRSTNASSPSEPDPSEVTLVSGRSMTPSSEVRLPYGNVTVVAYIFDSFGARAVYQLAVFVPSPPSLTESNILDVVRELSNALKDLRDSISTSSSPTATLGTIAVLTDLLNSQNDADVAEKTESRLNLLTAVAGLMNRTSSTDNVDLEQLVKVISSVTSVPSELGPDNLRLAISVLVTALDRYGQDLDDSQREGISINAAAIAANLLQSSNCVDIEAMNDALRQIINIQLAAQLDGEEPTTLTADRLTLLGQRTSEAMNVALSTGGYFHLPVCFLSRRIFRFLFLLTSFLLVLRSCSVQ